LRIMAESTSAEESRNLLDEFRVFVEKLM